VDGFLLTSLDGEGSFGMALRGVPFDRTKYWANLQGARDVEERKSPPFEDGCPCGRKSSAWSAKALKSIQSFPYEGGRLSNWRLQ
jgi:hypothetical protein